MRLEMGARARRRTILRGDQLHRRSCCLQVAGRSALVDSLDAGVIGRGHVRRARATEGARAKHATASVRRRHGERRHHGATRAPTTRQHGVLVYNLYVYGGHVAMYRILKPLA